MNESHESLSSDFEVSTGGIDTLAATIRSSPGIYGARMTGGGFGGCVIALAESGAAQRLNLSATNWVVAPSAGAKVEGDEDEASSR
jgi:galactokinase